MVDQWKSLLPNLMTPQAAVIFVLVLLAVIALVVLVVKRFHLPFFPQSLRNRLPLAFLGVAVVSVGVMSLALAVQLETTLETQKGNDFLVQAELNANRLDEQIDNQISRLNEVSRNYNVASGVPVFEQSLDKMSSEELAAHYQGQQAAWADPDNVSFRRSLLFNPVSYMLRQETGNLPLYSQIMVTDVYGGLAGAVGEEPEEFYFGNEVWWQQTRNSNQEDFLFLSTPYLAEDGQTVLVDIAMPLLDTKSNDTPILRGVLRAKLRLSDLTLFTESRLDKSIELALLDLTNNIWLFSSKYPQKVGTTVSEGVRGNIVSFPLNWGIDRDETGERVIRSHVVLSSSPDQPYLDALGLAIVLQQPVSVALSNRLDFIQPVLIGGGVALLLAGIIGYFIARQISRPIISLSNTAAAMAGGQLGQTAPVFGVSELKTLASSFNRMTDQLQQILLGLEQQVAARTERLEIVATLGERLSSILNVEDLLNEVVNQIQARFGYYHAHIYLLDDERQNMVVTAGTGSAGAKMKATGHSISLDAETSLVARAARTGEIVRVDNVREAPDWLPNKLLPDTYSEMAVPIVLEDVVVGVLDVQQDRIAGLDEGDASLLRSLAGQAAVAIRNARQFEEVEMALTEAREHQRLYVEQAWDRSKVARRGIDRMQFSQGAPTTLAEATVAEARRQAMATTEPTIIGLADPHLDNTGLNPKQALVAPITLHGITIGNLQLHEDQPDRVWTDSELTLVKTVVDQIAQVAENLRLIDETQERASREQLIGQISDKVRRAPDMETLLKIGIEEITRVLGSDRTFVRLGAESEFIQNLDNAPSPETPATPPSQNKPTATNGHGAANGAGELSGPAT